MLEFSLKKVAWDSLYLRIKFKVGLHHQGVHVKKNQEKEGKKKKDQESEILLEILVAWSAREASQRWAHLQENNQNQSREYITTKMLVCGTLSNAQIWRVCV